MVLKILKITGLIGLTLLLLLIGLFQTEFFAFRETDAELKNDLAKRGQTDVQALNITVHGQNIHYLQVGDSTKPLIVLVHGAPGSLSAFKSYLADQTLLEFAQVVAMDRPGYGFSDYGNTEPSLAAQAAKLKPILERHRKQKAILVGHSFGGPVIARMAMDYPDLVDGLVLVAGSISPALEPREWWRKPVDHPIMRALLPASMVVCNQEIIALYDELEAMMPLWKRIDCPVTVVQGEEDQLVPAENAYFAETMLTNSPQVALKMVEGGDHFILWSMQHEIVQYIKELVEWQPYPVPPPQG